MGTLRVDAATAEVLQAFETAGVESLLVKGASVARWLYHNEDPRFYVDCDLLVAPAQLTAAETVLAGLGFERAIDHRQMPAWWQEHGVEWSRRQDAVLVDLHRTLPGIGVDPDRLWLTLSGQREQVLVAGFQAQTVTIPARALLLVVHAAHHGEGWKRALADVDRAVSVVDFGTWREAAELAAALDAVPAFATGLRLTAGGREIASKLELPTNAPVGVILKATTPPPIALGFEQLARANGFGGRLAIVRHKLLPPPTFMRHWSPRAHESRWRLLLAYLWRPIWLLRHAPAGFKAWRAARRASSGS